MNEIRNTLSKLFNRNERKEIAHNPNEIISFGKCLRYIDLSLERFKNDSINGIAPSIRYGVKRNFGFEVVSVTAISKEKKLPDRLKRAANGNDYFSDLLDGKDSHEGSDYIPIAYILDFQAMKTLSNIKEIKQNWGDGPPGPGFEGLEEFVTPPGQGNYWEGEVRISFHDNKNLPCITIQNTCEAILIRREDVQKIKKWAQELRLQNIPLPLIPLFSPDGSSYFGTL